jgi:hypothetical protein
LAIRTVFISWQPSLLIDQSMLATLRFYPAWVGAL